MGYLEGDTFTVLSPVNRAEQYRIRPTDDDPYRMVPVEAVDSTQLRRATALYQTASDCTAADGATAYRDTRVGPDNPVYRGHCTPLPSMPFLQESYFTTGYVSCRIHTSGSLYNIRK